MFGLIDLPGPFAPTPQWQEFLERMLKLPQDEPQVEMAVPMAREVLAKRQADEAWPKNLAAGDFRRRYEKCTRL